MSNLSPLGVIHGRFQVLHNDHLIYLLAGKERCAHLVVGITNPDPISTAEDSTDPSRSSEAANPLTYFERMQLVQAALLGADLPSKSFSIVPFPIHFPDRYHYYVPMEAVFFLTIYDGWGEKKRQLLQSIGLQTEVLWRRRPEDKGISGSDVRRRIRDNLPWKHLVPPATVPLIEKFNLQARLQRHSQKH